mmetsp:Transcript_2334/g.3047  ORF Transcript_2334/g.3047 Transcript_2334/m.3047 type:complete len:309 (-) Transcript_2334:71-997(-)|eukprot:CAMPEP_0172507596 /NCGR_PEP_ID=MMETSP1066-20121228/204956_1 /TAXON_ID=671091 /ORGANISM="Coscinodiscus wailesii, Strain CCMP2513" /LENGTH=308 /DNA_ID=CAMNT_0013285191 /DNA_START=54 /DNA_END=980 /DNA_ORIENTATION=+
MNPFSEVNIEETTPLFPNEPRNSATSVFKSQIVSMNDRGSISFCSFAAIVTVVIVTLLGGNSVMTVQPGYVNVVTTFGRVESYEAGIHLINPFKSNIENMSIKTQLVQSHNTVPTKEGLAIQLDLALIYRLNPIMITNLYTTVGRDYADVLITPESNSALRILTAGAEAKALYTNGREDFQMKLKSMLETKLAKRGILLEDVLLKDVKLPDLLINAIEIKSQAEQDALKMKFVLEKEEQEAQRKAIEAKGIAEFQSIVTTGISPELLQWKGIEATEKFATSKNTKLVIMGNSKDDLPVLLNGDVGKDT